MTFPTHDDQTANGGGLPYIRPIWMTDDGSEWEEEEDLIPKPRLDWLLLLALTLDLGLWVGLLAWIVYR